MVQLRRECSELKRYLKEMQLADHNIDATDTALPPPQVSTERAHHIPIP